MNREGLVGESHLVTKGNYNHMEQKDGKGQSHQYREGGRGRRRTAQLEY